MEPIFTRVLEKEGKGVFIQAVTESETVVIDFEGEEIVYPVGTKVKVEEVPCRNDIHLVVYPKGEIGYLRKNNFNIR